MNSKMRNLMQSRAIRRKRATAPERATLRTLTLLIPRRYNADESGNRQRIERSKLARTIREMKSFFSGYSSFRTTGWTSDGKPGGIRDHHFRFEMDLLLTASVVMNLRTWKRILEDRFRQDTIYMRLSGPVIWL
jgi:hypothetical protein